MEIVLLAITIVSLLAAVIMSVVAWRLSRDERVRSSARVAALAAAATDESPDSQPVPQAVTHFSPRSRPAPLLREDVVTRPAAATASPPWAPARPPAPLGESFLGSSVAAPASGGQRGLALAAAILFVMAMTGAYWTIYGGRSTGTAVAVGDVSRPPVELVSLRHERNSTRLAITGLVRNPAGGGAVDGLSAVAFLFDQQGQFVTSSRADIDIKRLGPGDESPFVISVDAPSTVARYRVSFRNDAGVVPHIDRRGQEPIARDTP